MSGELWGVFCENFGENWLRYNGTALWSQHDASDSTAVQCRRPEALYTVYRYNKRIVVCKLCLRISHKPLIIRNRGTCTLHESNCDIALPWRHNERDGVSNHQPHDCLLNRLFSCRSKKTSKLCVTGLCEGNSPVTGEYPTQRASNAENGYIWWRHHACICVKGTCRCVTHFLQKGRIVCGLLHSTFMLNLGQNHWFFGQRDLGIRRMTYKTQQDTCSMRLQALCIIS